MVEQANPLDRVLASLPPPATPVETPVVTPVTNIAGEPLIEPPKPVEQVPETPAEPVTVAATPVVTEPTAVEPAKEWYEGDEPSTQPATSAAQPTTTPVATDPLLDDPEVKFILEQKKAGKNLSDIISHLSVTDNSNLPDREVVAQGLKDFKNKTADDIETIMSQFDSLTYFEQETKVNEFRNLYANRVQERQKLLSEPVTKQKEFQDQVINRFIQEVDAGTSKLVDQEFKNLKITAEMADDIKQTVLNLTLTREDGSFNTEDMIEFAIFKKYAGKLVAANVSKAKNSGRQEVLIATTNPSSNPSVTGQVNTGTDTTDAAYQEYLKSRKR